MTTIERASETARAILRPRLKQEQWERRLVSKAGGEERSTFELIARAMLCVEVERCLEWPPNETTEEKVGKTFKGKIYRFYGEIMARQLEG